MSRPPKPTQLKVVEGNRGKRALNSREPDPAYLNDLTPPAWLDPKSAEVWAEIAPKLRAARVLTEHAEDYDRWRQRGHSRRTLERRGMVRGCRNCG